MENLDTRRILRLEHPQAYNLCREVFLAIAVSTARICFGVDKSEEFAGHHFVGTEIVIAVELDTVSTPFFHEGTFHAFPVVFTLQTGTYHRTVLLDGQGFGKISFQTGPCTHQRFRKRAVNKIMIHVGILASVAGHQHHIFGIDFDDTAEVRLALAGGQHQAVLLECPCTIHIIISFTLIAEGDECTVFKESDAFFVGLAFRAPHTYDGLAVVHVHHIVVAIVTACKATHCHEGNKHQFKKLHTL